jgi:hypothetical protein
MEYLTGYNQSVEAPFEELHGKVITQVIGLEKESDEVHFICEDGTKYFMYHYPDCCESVNIEDIIGDTTDLLNTPIEVAEKRESQDKIEGVKEEDQKDKYGDSFTWTFYTLRTIKGTVTIRWFGTSNGYYSETVDFRRMK